MSLWQCHSTNCSTWYGTACSFEYFLTNMNKARKNFSFAYGFSLAEVLTALMIGSMILVAVLGIYSHSERSANSVTQRLDESRLPSEILQRIAEDLDAIVTSASDTKITIENQLEEGFAGARLTIQKTIYNSKNEIEVFEKIVWQTNYEPDANGLVLYRSYSGMGAEDKLLDESKETWQRELFVPICSGVTLFKIQVPIGEQFQDKWTSDSLPHGIAINISFATPVKSVTGTLEVPETKKITRTIAVDRTRKIKLIIKKKESKESKGREKQELKQSDQLRDILNRGL